jgi:mycofactocin precursor peptide peptidase
VARLPARPRAVRSASVQLAERTWTDLADTAPPLVCVPIGSYEQHGPHLPLGTDTLIAEALATGLSQRRADTVVGPTLTVTASGEHAGFPGTLSIGTGVTADVIVELVRSADWSGGVVLVNGHGGNREAVDHAVATLTAEDRRVLAWWPHVPEGDAHAGRTETALLLAVRPDLVRVERAEAGATEPFAALAGRLRAEGVRAVSPNGVLGDPRHASDAEGRELLGRLIEQLVAAVDSWRGEPS